MTESEVIDWFMIWATKRSSTKRGGPTWALMAEPTDEHPRWKVYKLCELLVTFKPEDLTPDALKALIATIKYPQDMVLPDWWPDGDWAHEYLAHLGGLGIKLWTSNWRLHRQDGKKWKKDFSNRHQGTDPIYDPPYRKIGVPKGI